MKDMFRMRLKIAQNYIKSLKEGITQVSGPGLGPSVRIHAQVHIFTQSRLNNLLHRLRVLDHFLRLSLCLKTSTELQFMT